jgi:hypothetical protein
LLEVESFEDDLDADFEVGFAELLLTLLEDELLDDDFETGFELDEDFDTGLAIDDVRVEELTLVEEVTLDEEELLLFLDEELLIFLVEEEVIF